MSCLKGWNIEDLEGCFKKKEEPTNRTIIRLSDISLPYNGETTTEYLIKAADHYASYHGSMPDRFLVPKTVYSYLIDEIGSLRSYSRASRSPNSDSVQLYCQHGKISVEIDSTI